MSALAERLSRVAFVLEASDLFPVLPGGGAEGVLVAPVAAYFLRPTRRFP